MDALLAHFPLADKRVLQASIKDANASKTVVLKAGDLACLLYSTLSYLDQRPRSAKSVLDRRLVQKCNGLIDSVRSSPEVKQTNTRQPNLRQPRIDQCASDNGRQVARPQQSPRPSNLSRSTTIPSHHGSIPIAQHRRRSSSSDLEIVGGPFLATGNSNMRKSMDDATNQLNNYGAPPPYESVITPSTTDTSTFNPVQRATPLLPTPNTTNLSRPSAPENAPTFRKRIASPFPADRSQRQRTGEAGGARPSGDPRLMAVQVTQKPSSPPHSQDTDEFGGDDVFSDMTASQVQRSFP